MMMGILMGSVAAGGGGTFTPTSTQSGNFLTRVGAVTGGNNTNHYGLSTNECTAVDALISGMVTDGTFALLDAMYVFKTLSASVGALNLISSSFNLVSHGSPAFTPDVGFVGAASSYLDTQLNPSLATTKYLQDDCSVWAGTSTVFSGSNDYGSMMCTASGSLLIRIYPHFSDTNFYSAVNQSTMNTDLAPTPGSFYGATRSSSANMNSYVDATNTGLQNWPSSSPPNTTIVVLADDNTGASRFTGNMTFAAIGGGMNSTQVGNFRTRIATYMASVP